MEKKINKEEALKALGELMSLWESLDYGGCISYEETEKFYNIYSIFNDYIKGGIKESYASSEKLSEV